MLHAQQARAPYKLIAADREIREEMVSTRRRDGVILRSMNAAAFSQRLLADVATRSVTFEMSPEPG